MKKHKQINLPLLFILAIFIGFLINVINQQLGFPIREIYGWLIVILGVMGYIVEGIVKGRFK